VRKAFYIGAVFGGILGITVALSMDLILGQSVGSGWTEAVAHDLNRLFKTNLSRSDFAVIIGVIGVIGIIGAFGSLIAGLFSMILVRFFKMLTKDR